MRRLLLRPSLMFALAWAAACADDISEVVTSGTSSGGETTTGPGTVSADTTAGQDTTDGRDTTTTTTTTTTGEPDSTSSSSSSSSSSSDSSSDSSSSDGTTGGPVCGNDITEDLEACDGRDLNEETCVTRGFDGGELACAADCSDYDTSSCTVSTCGDDVVDGDDVCDGTDLAGEDCVSLGFDAGTLACAVDCSGFDTSGCISFSCGNDVIEGMEVCDGTDLGGQTCASQGFGGGVLGCAPDCNGFDTSGCIVFSCGNDVIEDMEVCDGADLGGESCVSQGFDGGTLGCAPDCSAYATAACHLCGDGVAAGPEACDGADLLGTDCAGLGFDGGSLACDASCGFDTAACHLCGDGVMAGPEQCDGADLGGQTCQGLGFDFGNLMCGSGCGLDQIRCVSITTETEPNDDGMVAPGTNDFSAANANGPYTADALIAASIEPVGDDDVFAISNPGPGYIIVALETYGPVPGQCPAGVDTVLFLHAATGLQLAVNDDGGINSCSLLTGIPIPPGTTLYARVIDFGDNSAIASYHLHIRVDPVVCGDGVAGPGEQCDDGNLAAGDGCSATCMVEGAIQEIEPNGTSAQADAAGIVITGDAFIGGVIGPVLGDLDRFRLELADPQIVRFETFTSLGRCDPGYATTLRLFDAAGAQIIADTGALLGSGIANCAALVFPLPAGTFYVQVEETGNNSLLPTYLLEVQLIGDTGTETEPNEDLASANANLAGGVSDVYVFGDHTMQADSDYYAIDVPVAGSSLRLEIIEGDRAIETCESNGIDSRLTLYDAAGVQLVDDDDDGRGFCSLIDGTGATGQDANAHDLPAGTYYAQVRASTAAQANAGGQFIYRLVATVRRP
jgi:cysteine-rich repeat protein